MPRRGEHVRCVVRGLGASIGALRTAWRRTADVRQGPPCAEPMTAAWQAVAARLMVLWLAFGSLMCCSRGGSEQIQALETVRLDAAGSQMGDVYVGRCGRLHAIGHAFKSMVSVHARVKVHVLHA